MRKMTTINTYKHLSSAHMLRERLTWPVTPQKPNTPLTATQNNVYLCMIQHFSSWLCNVPVSKAIKLLKQLCSFSDLWVIMAQNVIQNDIKMRTKALQILPSYKGFMNWNIKSPSIIHMRSALHLYSPQVTHSVLGQTT
jgi:hypothetical protein